MNSSSCRILIIDDNPSIHDDFKRILMPQTSGSDLDADAAALLGIELAPSAGANAFQLESALQGQEAREKVIAANAAGKPFALAFVDMRMPPGWDGLTTITKLWEIDPALHVVICTAHTDRTWDEIEAALTARDRWAVLKKPFDKIEVLQLAHVMTSKWTLARAAVVQ
jgi:two-component system, NtrC family, sensor kinase